MLLDVKRFMYAILFLNMEKQIKAFKRFTCHKRDYEHMQYNQRNYYHKKVPSQSKNNIVTEIAPKYKAMKYLLYVDSAS